jgi:hypothetical protein
VLFTSGNQVTHASRRRFMCTICRSARPLHIVNSRVWHRQKLDRSRVFGRRQHSPSRGTCSGAECRTAGERPPTWLDRMRRTTSSKRSRSTSTQPESITDLARPVNAASNDKARDPAAAAQCEMPPFLQQSQAGNCPLRCPTGLVIAPTDQA